VPAILSPKRSFKVPVYADCLSPDVLAGRSLREISALALWEGNKKRALCDLFDIQGEAESLPENNIIQIQGDLSKVRRIGTNMTAGRIIVQGNVGMHLGEMMRDGQIVVQGNVDSWLGSMMTGGRIEVKGSAADYVGAPYRGSTRGMRGGIIVIEGDAGSEVGCFMRGGTIRIGGNVRDFVGIHMRDGTILVQGNCDGRPGAGMLKGRIVIAGRVSSILPTFTIDSIRPTVGINGERVVGPFYRFSGDIADQGDGRLYVSKDRNPHLSFYEKYL